jgi:hypothetical protein
MRTAGRLCRLCFFACRSHTLALRGLRPDAFLAAVLLAVVFLARCFARVFFFAGSRTRPRRGTPSLAPLTHAGRPSGPAPCPASPLAPAPSGHAGCSWPPTPLPGASLRHPRCGTPQFTSAPADVGGTAWTSGRVRRQSEIDKEIAGAAGKSVTDDRAPVIGGLTESRTVLSGTRLRGKRPDGSGSFAEHFLTAVSTFRQRRRTTGGDGRCPQRGAAGTAQRLPENAGSRSFLCCVAPPELRV